ncbi:hypothetical protein [Chromobacterium subtsugae]|uniref:hypothetical protein n=1 Tax=Chromobacterium subtsugae TaxID=251747 RepID=UPI00064187AC|nr:hypothetical protein [Chromobacterium subtsugae]OBU85345.1 hypothetical protein MY55_16925 [Chromobacterium subtsugae]
MTLTMHLAIIAILLMVGSLLWAVKIAFDEAGALDGLHGVVLLVAALGFPCSVFICSEKARSRLPMPLGVALVGVLLLWGLTRW